MRLSCARAAFNRVGPGNVGARFSRRTLTTDSYPGVIAAAVLERRAIIGKEPLPVEVEFDEVQRAINEVATHCC